MFQIGQEDIPIGWRLDGHGCLQAFGGQRRQHGHGMPVALGCTFRHPFSTRSPAIVAGHLGAGPTLIQKHQLLRVDPAYAFLPRSAALLRFRRFLFLRVE